LKGQIKTNSTTTKVTSQKSPIDLKKQTIRSVTELSKGELVTFRRFKNELEEKTRKQKEQKFVS